MVTFHSNLLCVNGDKLQMTVVNNTIVFPAKLHCHGWIT